MPVHVPPLTRLPPCRCPLPLQDQSRGGHVFNMDGAGADGNATPRFAAYGATKRSLAQLGKSLASELKMLKISNVGIHNLSPGMVTTELLLSGRSGAQPAWRLSSCFFSLFIHNMLDSVE